MPISNAPRAAAPSPLTQDWFTTLGVAMQEAAAGRPVADVLKDVQAVSDQVER